MSKIIVRRGGLGVWLLAACSADGQPEPPSAPPPPAATASLDLRYEDPQGFEPLPPPGPTGWRARFPGPGQSYVDYLATVPRRPAASDYLYLLPLGDLGTAFVVDAEFTYIVRTPPVEALAEVTEAFFGVSTSVLDPLDLEQTLEPHRVESGHEQYRAQDVLAATAYRMPGNGFSMTALIVRDLYFDDAQAYGFGFGQHRDGQAVVSFARLDPAVSGLPRPDDILERLPLRGYKLLIHEVGHTFGFEHCTEYRCIMNGFADLEELDATPLHLGPQCLRKLMHVREFDAAARYETLAERYDAHGLSEPAAWVRGRAERLRR